MKKKKLTTKKFFVLLLLLAGICFIGGTKKSESLVTQPPLRLSEEVTFSEITRGENGHASVTAKVMPPDLWILGIDSYARSRVKEELYRIRIRGYEIDRPIMADYRPGEVPCYLINLIRKTKK